MITQKRINAELERLITISCELNGRHSIKSIAERVLKLNIGTKEDQKVLKYMLDNNLIKDLTFKYVEE